MSNNGSKWIRPKRRQRIYARDRNRCVYCLNGPHNSHTLTLDHVIPLEYGGTHHHANLVTACYSCNSKKQARSMRAFLLYLRRLGHDTDEIGRRIRNALRRTLPKDQNSSCQQRKTYAQPPLAVSPARVGWSHLLLNVLKDGPPAARALYSPGQPQI